MQSAPWHTLATTSILSRRLGSLKRGNYMPSIKWGRGIKKTGTIEIQRFPLYCVQDEDTRFEMFCFGLFSFVVVMFYINN